MSRVTFAGFLLLALLCVPLAAQDQSKAPPGKPSAEAEPLKAQAKENQEAAKPTGPLPAAATTSHSLELPGRSLHFIAKTGAVNLSAAQSGAPLADIAYVAFLRDGADAEKRPITFAINGGPGAGSAWLNLGGLGPWRLPLDGGALPPSADPRTVPNAETWLDFTDLVFIDPPGTGYSRILTNEDSAKRHFYSVDGDIETLAVVIRKWLVENKRLESPKFIAGESYGGFRGPKLARLLQDQEGIGIRGLVLISPVLDFSWFEGANNPLISVTRLPSLTAAARHLSGPDGREKLADVEAYAQGPYITDLLRGPRDAAALSRLSEKVAQFTGLDPLLVRRHGGYVDAVSFMREHERATGRTLSLYDALIAGYDPNPQAHFGDHADPVLDSLKTPLASAIAHLAATKLNWFIDARYEILNESVNRQWDGRAHAESLSDLKRILALDPNLRVLVAHGVTDEVTPYFASKLLLDQIPPMGNPARLRLVVYGGGHMIYADDVSRAALREDARKVIEGE
ncbi:MAG: S10 family peptidase [Beijerinckiaceae bacterium]